MRLDTEHVVPRASRRPHLVVLQQIQIAEHPQMGLVAEGGRAIFVFGNLSGSYEIESFDDVVGITIWLMLTKRIAMTWLQTVLVVVLIYSLALVFAGRTAGSLFSWLGFGPDDSIDTLEVRDYLRLPFMVLGAVLTGWTFLMIQLVRGPLSDGSRWAWLMLVQSLVLWFFLDTGMSLVLGYPTHALFNIPFAIAIGIPLLSLRPPKR